MRYCLGFILFFTTQILFGQITYSPIVKPTKKSKNTNARTENTTINLPFWDDFSFAIDNVPSDSLWFESDGVYVGNGLGANPPSIGVASLDGVNASGQGYTGSTTGPTDALTSCFIDLSSLTVADEVFLSFYYQFGGNGENPEDSDSIRVEMLNSNEEWITVWPRGSILDRSGEFVQQLIRLDSDNFFHEAFQFKIQSFGRPVGFFDVWNIDYVYMNSDRSLNDDNYPDRTIGKPLTSILNGFTSVPAKHYRTNQNQIPEYEVTSVDNPNDERQPYDNFYSAQLITWLNNVGDTSEIAPVFRDTESVQAPNRNTESIDDFFTNINIPEDQDSIFLNVKTFINPTDNVLPPTGDYDLIFDPIDFRINDTVRNHYVLKDYYAYDDGSAELTAGLNFSGNRLAIQFPVPPTVEDTLIAIDMYFPLSITEPAGRSVDVIVWDKVDTIPGDIIYRETFTILRDAKPNKFIRYEFSNPVAVADTFFIGYRQNNEGVLGVGYDIDNNSNDKVFFNIGTLWQQKPAEDLKGSFMIRPVFGKFVPDDVTGIDDQLFKNTLIYPNPTTGVIHIEGEIDRASLYDLYGRAIETSKPSGDKITFDLSQQPAGIYLVNVIKSNQTKTFKIIKK
ncbi:T9SS type A sorting domain-containing protein [Fulvivirga lutea]|uniref:T9SS type A sorting domain-containing protein n=1 Tax=Fulvivirga lutea TaxID=2810512 RepID=A0A974WPE8_9BACT|nr:T9SS type A sorting domain-containing protein [Fulvivirga lutea]QSE99213.1 T9SS type A sorting domain-containing protein [Fulvivirga lutea]